MPWTACSAKTTPISAEGGADRLTASSVAKRLVLRRGSLPLLLAASCLLAEQPAVASAPFSLGEQPRFFLPGLTGALVEDARAPRENPAGLAFMAGSELQVLHLRTGGAATTAYHYGVRLGALALGGGQEWLETPAFGRERRTSLSLAVGDRQVAAGANARWLWEAGADERRVSYDAGVAVRMHPWLALSIGARELGISERTSYSTGLGLRLLRDKATLGVDRVWSRADSFLDFDGLISWAVVLRLARGLMLSGQLVHPMAGGLTDEASFQVALTFDLPAAGLTLGYAPSQPLRDDAYAAIRLSTARHRTPLVRREQVLIDLEQFLAPVETLLFPGPAEDPFLALIRLLDQARRDPEITALVMRTSGRAMLSFAEVEELRQSMSRLQRAGKSVYFFLDGADDWTVYLASSADKVIAAPTAAFSANGLAVTSSYFAEGLERIGVRAEFVRAGEYKTSPDALERRSMSNAEREALEAILYDTWRRYVSDTAQGLGLERSKLEEALARGVYGAAVALEEGLVDAIAYPDEISDMLAADGHRPNIVTDYEDRLFADRRWGRPRTVAVVPVTGTIVQGETPSGIFQRDDVTGSATVVRALRRAVEDPSIAAIVLRVDSPGGEAHAADLIWRAVKEADAEKPVIASLGTTAASGGYYVAAAARRIVSTPSTITGSIGVFAGGVDVSGLLEKLGINRVTLKRGELADLFSIDRPFTDEERAVVQAFIDASYEQFLERVAEGRKLSRDQVHLVARGRIWTGAQALTRDLVDQLGTFQDAVESAKEAAGISPEEVVEVSLFTGINGPLAAFTGRGRPLASLFGSPAGNPVLERLLEVAGPLLWVDLETPLALMPYTVEVR